jgi:D-alanyl-D-alanine carboxypeptidase
MLLKSIQPGCGQIEIRKILTELSPPFISAKSWAIADGRTGQVLFGRCDADKREIASLTKIMTAYLALRLSSTYNVDLYHVYAEVSEHAATVGGTSAMLKEGDKLSLIDLLYGMLLPSGNDAAIVVAEYFGRLLIKPKTKDKKIAEPSHNETLTPEMAFVIEMNNMAKQLKLVGTFYWNSHGMYNYYNRSTAAELARLSSIAMKDSTFKKIVSKKSYIAIGYDVTGKEKEYLWQNTNKMLGKSGCNGIKTGVTETAGPCLVTNLQLKAFLFIIVLLNSKTMDVRWDEVIKLKEWAIERLKQIEKISKKSKKYKRKVLRTFKHI